MRDNFQHPESAMGQVFPNCPWRDCSCLDYCANSFFVIALPEFDADDLARKRKPIFMKKGLQPWPDETDTPP
jgi:hypothetical protein